MVLAGLPLDEREMILDVIAKVRQRLLTPEKVRELDIEERFPEEIIRELLGPEIGLQLLFIPEEYGGLGGGARDIAAISEALSRICLGISTAFLAIHLGADPILVGATPEQKEKWLGKIADEGAIVAYAVTEPDAGSNLANFKTTATPVINDDGTVKAYRINGTKQFISNGGYADFLTVLAQSPEGPSFFVVEKDTPGFKAGKPEIKHGIRCANTAPLTFDNVEVPVENLIGGVPGKGLHQANEVFGYTRLMVAAFGLGAGMAALEKVIPYAKQRIQFGSPLYDKQGYTHKLIVPNIVRLEGARAYIEETAERIDAGEKNLQVEGSIAKYLATEAGNSCADDAIQALGGYGYITEYDVEKIKRDVKITTIYEGTSEIQQMIIGTFRWRTTIKSKGAYYEQIASSIDDVQKAVPDIHAQYLAGLIRHLNSVIQWVHKARLTRQQHVMFRLAHLMAMMEAGAALAKKVRRHVESGSRQKDALRLIFKLYLRDIAETAVPEFNLIMSGTDKKPDAGPGDLIEDTFRIMKTVQSGSISDMDRLATLY